MGMDVYGKKPANERGEYFRNNVWWWRPLWDYCLEIAPELCGDVSGHYNDGDGLNAEDSIKLAEKLFAEIDSGRTALYGKERDEFLQAIPNETCGVCDGRGWITPPTDTQNAEFMDFVTDMVKSGQVVTVDSTDNEFIKAMEQGVKAQIKEPKQCGKCEGKGECRPWATEYPFSVDNVREFAEFAKNSGGFEIC